MNRELFEDWLHEFDRKFALSKRKIELITNNCMAHMGRIDFPTSKHSISYTNNGSKYHSSFES